MAKSIGLPTPRHEGRLEVKRNNWLQILHTSSRQSSISTRVCVASYILEVHPFLNEHFDILHAKYPSKGDRVLMQLHNKTFTDWFHNRVICEELKGYDVNGFTFWTKGQDKKSSYLQNSGISISVSSTFYANVKESPYPRHVLAPWIDPLFDHHWPESM